MGLFEFATGLLVFAIVYGSGRAIFWLSANSLKKSQAKTLIIAVTLGAIAVICVAAYLCSAVLRGELPFMH